MEGEAEVWNPAAGRPCQPARQEEDARWLGRPVMLRPFKGRGRAGRGNGCGGERRRERQNNFQNLNLENGWEMVR